jgi:hypothetical protein
VIDQTSRILPTDATVLGPFRCHGGWLARRLRDARVLLIGPGGEAAASAEPWHAVTTAAITSGVALAGRAQAILRPHSAIVIRHPPHRRRVARLLLRNVPAGRPTIAFDPAISDEHMPALVVDPRQETVLLSALAGLGVLNAVLDLHMDDSHRLEQNLMDVLRNQRVALVEGALHSANWLLELERSEQRRRRGHVARIAQALARSVSDSTDPG